MKHIIGIDPGLNGAVAILRHDLEIIELVSMPTIPYGTTKRVYAPALRDLLAPYATAGKIAVLEDVHARPSDAGVPMGRGAAFTFGGSFHVALVTLEMAGIGVRLIAPSAWKVRIGLQLPKGATRTQKKQASEHGAHHAQAVLACRSAHAPAPHRTRARTSAATDAAT